MAETLLLIPEEHSSHELTREAEISETFKKSVEPLEIPNKLITKEQAEELEKIPMLKPSGRSDQGWRED